MMMEKGSGLEMLAILNNLTWLLTPKYLIAFCRHENLQEIVPNSSRVCFQRPKIFSLACYVRLDATENGIYP
jgi:hypothetical protein